MNQESIRNLFCFDREELFSKSENSASSLFVYSVFSNLFKFNNDDYNDFIHIVRDNGFDVKSGLTLGLPVVPDVYISIENRFYKFVCEDNSVSLSKWRKLNNGGLVPDRRFKARIFSFAGALFFLKGERFKTLSDRSKK